MRKAIIVCLLLFPYIMLTSLPGQTKTYYARGHITENGKTIHIKDSIGIWNSKNNRLKIYFFPFELTEKDIKMASKGSPASIAFKKPSPDKSKWQWCPYGAISIKFKKPIVDKKLETITWINYILYGLTKKNHTMNINRSGKKARDSFGSFAIRSQTRNYDILEMSTKGEHVSFSGDSKYSWNLKGRTKISVIK